MAERLTKRFDSGNVGFFKDGTPTENAMKLPKIMELLAAYEDLGTVEEFAELVEAKQDGRCVVLPCKVGDTVWYLDRCESLPPKVVSGTVDGYLWFRLCGFALNVVWSEPIMGHFGYSRKEMPFTQIGKTVFLTREEAETALTKEG